MPANLAVAAAAVAPRFAGYPEDEFKTASREPRTGAKAKVQFYIHPGYVEQLMIYFHSHQLPYDTPEAMFRHAIRRHEAWLKEVVIQLPGGVALPSIHEHLEIQNRIVMEEERMLSFTAHIDKIEEVVRKLGEMPGGERRAVEVLRDLWADIQEMPVGYWRAVYRKMFRKRFGPWLRRTPHGANLIPMAEFTDDEYEYATNEEEGGESAEWER